MSLLRFFSIIFVLGFWQGSGEVFASSKSTTATSNPVVILPFTAPDTPDMPSDDPNEPDGRTGLMFTAPDTPDMPSDDPNEPDGHPILTYTAPDTPDMPSDDPNEPDGRQQKANRQSMDKVPSSSAIWDRALGWLKTLLDFS